MLNDNQDDAAVDDNVESPGGLPDNNTNVTNGEKDDQSVHREEAAVEIVETNEERAESEKLNVAYEALENMRIMNLQVTCSELGIPCEEAHAQKCSACLILNGSNGRKRDFPRLRQFVDKSTKHLTSAGGNNRFPSRLRLIIDKSKQAPPCLICGSPVCRSHSSAELRKASMTVCQACENLFSANFVIDCLTTPDDTERRRKMAHMIDSYDRALLLLRYSSQFIEAVAGSLEETKERQNKVGLGSSSAGILSGALGIAAAATMMTPAGPPLLIASLLFGGSATAVQTGTEVRDHFSEPNTLADKLIALNAVRLSILVITGILRDAMVLNHIRSDHYCPDTALSTTVLTESPNIMTKGIDNKYQKNRASVLGSLTFARTSVAAGVEASRVASAAETGVVVGRNARFLSRATTNAMRTARVARFAGGALSALVLVLEAKNMSNTIYSIMNGSPCEKAEQLRAIAEDLKEMVETNELDRECKRYLQIMKERQRVATEEEVTKFLADRYEAAMEEVWSQELAIKQEVISSEG